MSSRTVAVVLRAQVDDYIRQMRAAQRQTDEVDRAARTATEQLRIHNEALSSLGTGMVAIGATAAVGLGVAIKASAEFGSKMAQLQTLSHGTANEMRAVSEAAMSQGKAFGYSASQVADAQIELQKAGIGIKDQLGGALQGALTLAAAGQIDVADATSIAVQAMTQFGLSAKDVPHIADQLASAADSSVGSVDSIGQSLNQAGLVANQFGWSLEETVGTLTAFSQAGLNGSDGGTSLKTALLALATPTKQQSEAMKTLGIDVFDASGHFVSAAGLADQLQKGLGKVDDEARLSALGIIFGSDAARAAGVAYEQGAAGINKYIEGNDRVGFASAQAAGKLNSLEGDVQKLAAAFNTDLIKAGSSADGSLRGVAQTATALLDVLGGGSQPVMAIGVGLTALVATTGLVGGAALLAVPKIVAFRATLDELGISGRRAAGYFAKGAALTVGITALAGGLANLGARGTASAEQLAQAGDRIRSGFKDIDKVFPRSGVFDLFEGGEGAAKESLEVLTSFAGKTNVLAANFLDGATAALTFGVAGTHLGDVFKSNEQTFDALGQQLAGLAQQDYSSAATSFNQLVKQMGGGVDTAKKLISADVMPAYRAELVELAKAAGVNVTEANLLDIAQRKGAAGAKVLAASQAEAAEAAAVQADATRILAGQASTGAASVDDLRTAIENLDRGQLAASDAAIAMEQAIDDITDAVARNGKGLDINTEAGRKNRTELNRLAESTKSAAQSALDAGESNERVADIVGRGKKKFIDAAAAMLGSRDAALDLAKGLFEIPATVNTAVDVTGLGDAKQKVADLKELINGLPRYFYVDARIRNGEITPGAPASIAAPVKRAGGGGIFGAGPKGVDSVYAILAPGEHVFTASEVDRMGGQGAVSAFRADLMAFAKGGPVNAIDQQKNLATQAQRQEEDYQRQVIAQKKRAAAAEKAADAAQNRYEDIDGTKKNAAAKKAAKKAADEAKKHAEDAAKKVDELRTKRDKAKDAVSAANDAAATLRNDAEDFVSNERRGGSDPLAYVDQLRAASRNDNYSAAQRAEFKKQANSAEEQITSTIKSQDAFSKAIEASTKTLDDNKKTVDDATSSLESLKSTAVQLASSVSSSISGKYQATSAVTAATADRQVDSGWFDRDGIRYSTTSTVAGDKGGATTAASLNDYYSNSASATGVFANQLQQLAGRSVDRKYLAEIAGYGPDQGGAIAQALLSASDSEFRSINSNYAATLANSDRAGGLVSDYTYGSAINAAQDAVNAAQATYTAQQAVVASQQAAADQITKQLASDGASLRHLMATAFGVTGYATGTASATAGIHWVGERGPELAGVRAGETILNAVESKRWVSGYGGGGAPMPRITVQAPQVVMPDTITLRDARGFVATMEVVADRRIAVNDAHDAVLMMGGAAI